MPAFPTGTQQKHSVRAAATMYGHPPSACLHFGCHTTTPSCCIGQSPTARNDVVHKPLMLMLCVEGRIRSSAGGVGGS